MEINSCNDIFGTFAYIAFAYIAAFAAYGFSATWTRPLLSLRDAADAWVTKPIATRYSYSGFPMWHPL